MLHQHERVGGLPLARRGGSPVVVGAGASGGGGGEGKKGALGGVPLPVFAGGDWKEATKLVRR